MPLKKMSFADHVRFWAVKVWYAAVFVVVPIIVLGWLQWLIGFLVLGLVGGFILSIVFQLAHTIEDAQFPVADMGNPSNCPMNLQRTRSRPLPILLLKTK